jgi:hypothetical protein
MILGGAGLLAQFFANAEAVPFGRKVQAKYMPKGTDCQTNAPGAGSSIARPLASLLANRTTVGRLLRHQQWLARA